MTTLRWSQAEAIRAGLLPEPPAISRSVSRRGGAANPKAGSSLVSAIMDYLELHQYSPIRVNPLRYIYRGGRHQPVRTRPSQKGCPDILCPKPPDGRLYAIEVKVGAGELSADQEVMKERLLMAGCLWITARSVDDVQAHFPGRC